MGNTIDPGWGILVTLDTWMDEVERRAREVDSGEVEMIPGDQVLQSLHKIDPEIEKAWAKETRRRLDDYEQGKIEALPGEQFNKEIQELNEQESDKTK